MIEAINASIIDLYAKSWIATNGKPKIIEANIKPILCTEFITVFSAVNGSDLLKLWHSELYRLAAEKINNV